MTQTQHEETRLPESVRGLLDREWRLLVGGRRVCAQSGATYEDVSPVTEETIAHVPDGHTGDVDAAVGAAQLAQPEWSGVSPRERGAIVSQLADVVAEHAEELALLDTIDAGAPVSEMRGDAAAAANLLRFFAGLATEMKGETTPATSKHLHYTTRESFGVVGRIIPFNHPLMFAAGKIAAPLVAGNSVILKPAEASPLSALRIGELFCGVVPEGVLSVVVGDGPSVPTAIVRHPLVRRIGFTGSEPTGRAIQRDAAECGVKHVTLELGGKNALVAFPDADPDEVAESAVNGMNFTWSGQSCGSTSRLLVHESIAADVVQRIVERLAARRIRCPFDPSSEMGTMASRAQYDKALGYIEAARAEGAEVVTGGGRPEGVGVGLFIAPTVLGNVRPDMRIAHDEVFGPVLSVITWREEKEALEVANSVKYGLTASVWTNDIRRGHRFVRELQAGYVWINGSSQHFLGTPFGGVKDSGIGREESLEELLSYTQSKTVHVMSD